MSAHPTIITGATLVSDEELLPHHALCMANGLIQDRIDSSQLTSYASHAIHTYPSEYYLLPAGIDLHIHGANGADVMDGHADALHTIAKALLQEGVTGFLATTMSAEMAELEAVLQQIAAYTENQPAHVAALLGIHLEGPFISPNRLGAQRQGLARLPDIQLFKRWQALSHGLIKIVTLAPELPGALDFIAYLKSEGVIASLGHSDADYVTTEQAIQAGASHATHLFNAMRGLHQREPGVLGSLLMHPDVHAELIVDNCHLHSAIVDLAWRIKGVDRLLLVSDAMRAKCLADGQYELGGQQVHVRHGQAQLADGTLAGSTVTLNKAMRYFQQSTGADVIALSKMTSVNPARQLNLLTTRGSLQPGKFADCIILRADFSLCATYRAGIRVFHASPN